MQKRYLKVRFFQSAVGEIAFLPITYLIHLQSNILLAQNTKNLGGIVISIYQNPTKDEVLRLLEQNNLPSNDLSELDLSHFYGCSVKGESQGIIGLEVFGTDGLLRSFAVSENAQGKGCGAALLSELEQYSRKIGIENLYLLTNTAERYFLNKGYTAIPRELASEAIQSTKEFSSLCPASATLMHKPVG